MGKYMGYGDALSIENDFFAAAREKFDENLNEVFLGMESRGIDAAEITLKLSVAVFDRTVRDEDGEERIARVPAAHFKVSRTMKVSDQTGGFCGKDCSVELLRRGDEFRLREFKERDEQISIWEDECEDG